MSNRFKRFEDLELAMVQEWDALKNMMKYVVPKSSEGRGWLKQYWVRSWCQPSGGECIPRVRRRQRE